LYRKRKWLEDDNCNNVPKRTKLNAEQHCDYTQTHKNVYAEYIHNYRQCKAQENNTQAGNSHAAYMREYRKRMRLEEVNCNNLPKGTKLNAG
jgi:hypothetical protein